MRIRYQNKQSKAHTQSSAPDKKLEQQEQWQFNKFIRLSNIFSPSHTYAYPLSCTHFVSDISQVIHFECSLSRCVMRKCFGNGFRFFENQMHLQLLVYVSSFNPSLSLWVGPSYLLTHIHGQCVMTPPLQLYPENKKTKKQQSNSIRFNGKSTESE